MQTNILYNADCLGSDGMQLLEESSVDLIICDLPYGTTACAWDSVLPFDKLWENYARVLKDDGTVILFGTQPFTTALINSNLKWFREEIVWLKNRNASGIHAKQKHLKVHENIIVFSKKSGYTYNPQKWEVLEKQFLTQRKTMCMYGTNNNVYGGFERQRKADDGTRNPISVVAYKVPTTPSKTKVYSEDLDMRIHPTQKPLELLEYLVRTFSNEGELVLDNCCGSGTTLVACVNTGREYIGYEKQKTYYTLAKGRLERALVKREKE